MSKMYEIEIEETLQKVVKIKADSLEDAISIAKERYKNEEYILNEDNFMGAEFSEYKDEVIKEKSKQNHKDTR